MNCSLLNNSFKCNLKYFARIFRRKRKDDEKTHIYIPIIIHLKTFKNKLKEKAVEEKKKNNQHISHYHVHHVNIHLSYHNKQHVNE